MGVEMDEQYVGIAQRRLGNVAVESGLTVAV